MDVTRWLRDLLSFTSGSAPDFEPLRKKLEDILRSLPDTFGPLVLPRIQVSDHCLADISFQKSVSMYVGLVLYKSGKAFHAGSIPPNIEVALIPVDGSEGGRYALRLFVHSDIDWPFATYREDQTLAQGALNEYPLAERFDLRQAYSYFETALGPIWAKEKDVLTPAGRRRRFQRFASTLDWSAINELLLALTLGDHGLSQTLEDTMREGVRNCIGEDISLNEDGFGFHFWSTIGPMSKSGLEGLRLQVALSDDDEIPVVQRLAGLRFLTLEQVELLEEDLQCASVDETLDTLGERIAKQRLAFVGINWDEEDVVHAGVIRTDVLQRATELSRKLGLWLYSF